MNNNLQNSDLKNEVPEKFFTPMNPVNLAERKAKKISTMELIRKFFPKEEYYIDDPRFVKEV